MPRAVETQPAPSAPPRRVARSGPDAYLYDASPLTAEGRHERQPNAAHVEQDRDSVLEGIIRLAADLCNAPIGLLALFDEASRPWFRISTGPHAPGTRRTEALCDLTLRHGGPLVVREPRADLRFHPESLSTTLPGFRFYAGVPLESSQGRRAGALCVIDDRDRGLGAGPLEALQVLARAVVHEVEHRRVSRLLTRATTDVRRLHELVPMCACCKKVRDESGDWHEVDSYLVSRTGNPITHSYCAGCEEALLAE